MYKYIYTPKRRKKSEQSTCSFTYGEGSGGLTPGSAFRQTPADANSHQRDALPVLGRRAAVERRMHWADGEKGGSKGGQHPNGYTKSALYLSRLFVCNQGMKNQRGPPFFFWPTTAPLEAARQMKRGGAQD